MSNDIINDFLNSNGLENHKNHIVKVRHKLDKEIPYTLEHILEDFREYMEMRAWDVTLMDGLEDD
jgi:hypothetical protein